MFRRRRQQFGRQFLRIVFIPLPANNIIIIMSGDGGGIIIFHVMELQLLVGLNHPIEDQLFELV